jgi:prephenate dehydratase/prephenate dehydrogenase
MSALPVTRITIVGLGLLGGSFGLALRQAGAVRDVVGVDVAEDIIQKARECGAIDRGSLDVKEAMVGADIVVLAMPVRTIIELLPDLVLSLPRETLLFDLGSTKGEISRAIDDLDHPVRYVGGHPMAGTEHAGIEAAQATLFSSATFALVPHPPVDDAGISILTDIIRRIGANPTVISADRHDRIVAKTSHVPYLLSSALVRATEESAQTDPRLWDFAAGGFRDTSRVAASNVRVMADICLTNRAHVLSGLADAQSELGQIAQWIRDGDRDALEKALSEARTVRTRVFGERGQILSTKKVSFQGERGAFSEIAALEYFGDIAEPVPQPWFDDAFDAVEKGHCDYGMLPIENSLAGSIHVNYDLLLKHSLSVVGEIKLRIVHNLLVNKGVTFEDVKKVQSHPKALEQCVDYFRKHEGLTGETVYDTAGAAKMLKESGARDTAVIASSRAASHYGLEIIERGVEDNPQNYTRFLVLAPQPEDPQGDRVKTTLVFSVANVPGSLFKAMSVFALRDISVLKIESRPLIGSPWEYLFYLDIEGRADSQAGRRAIDHLQEFTTYYKMLGTYGEGRTVDSA